MSTSGKDGMRPFDPIRSPRNTSELFKKFFMLSSVRGVPRIFKARNKLLKTLWIITVIVFLFGTLLQLADIILNYLQFGKVQEQRMSLRTSSRFPDVTLCSLQPFPADRSDHGRLYSKVEGLIGDYFFSVKDKLQEKGSYHEKYEDVNRDDLGSHGYDDYNNAAQMMGEDYYGDTDDPHFKEMEGTFYKRRKKRNSKQLFQVDKDNMSIIDEETLEEIMMTTAGFYQNLNDSLRNRLGLHGPGSFIQSCSYTLKDEDNLRTENCKIGLHRHPQYFNCYTAKLASPSGVVLKMSLRLFLNDSIQLFYPDDYITDVDSQLHGVKLLIHEPDSYPDLTQRGYDIPPGMAAKLFLSTTIKKFLPEPYGDCKEDTATRIDDKGRKYRYEKQTCLDQCIQTWINKKCGCIDPWVIGSNEPQYEHLPFCANLNTTLGALRWRLACMYDYELRPPSECQECKMPCRRNEYNTVLSLSKWPHESHHFQIRTALYGGDLNSNSTDDNDTINFDFDAMFNHLVRDKGMLFENHYQGYFRSAVDLEKAKEDTKRVLMDTDTFQRNFVSVTVMRDSFEALVIQEAPETSLGEMLSKIGGTLSFWLGITLVTVMEAVELLYDFCGMMICRRRSKDNTTENGVDDREAEMNLTEKA
jgi:amiloride-sensitive sodium channel subunit alpha